MVGVPGKSKGCHICKRRKIKCDLGRPECLQCVKSKRSCTGYHREVVFRIATQDGPISDRPCRQTSSPHPGGPDEDGKKRGCSQPKGCEASGLSRSIHHRKTFQAQFFQAFIDSYIPEAERSNGQLHRGPISWLQMAPDVLEHSDVLSSAMSALSVARVGRQKQDHRLSMEARGLYGKALSDLQTALCDKTLIFREETLAASMAMGIYELLECPGEDISGWRTHGRGTARLVQLRGSNLHRSPLAHQLFEGFRLEAIYQAIMSRRATFLVESEWMMIPWKNNLKTIDDRLMDLMAQIPSLLEQADWIKTVYDPHEALRERLKLVDSCWALDAELIEWRKSVEGQSGLPQYWPEFSKLSYPVDNSEHGKVFPIAWHFPNLRIAMRYIHFWTALQLLHSTIIVTYRSLRGEQCDRSVPEHPADRRCSVCSTTPGTIGCHCGYEANVIPFNTNSLPPPSQGGGLHESSRNVAQSVEYCMGQDMGDFGSQVLIFPLRCTIECYRHRPGRELQWCLAASAELGTKKRLPFVKRMVAVRWESAET